MAWTTYLLRYGELGIKSRAVRKRFEDVLIENLEASFARAGATCLIERSWGRIYLDSPNDDVARRVLSHTFGLVSASPTAVTAAEMAAITEHLATIAPDHIEPGQSFAIRARRTGDHPFTSQDVGVEGGAAVWDAVGDLEVDLDDPDVEFFVEVRNDKAYVFTEVIQAPGGLPTGSQGTVVVPFMGPRSPAAAWLVMRRGARVVALVPEGCEPVARTLTDWAPGLELRVVEGPATREGLLRAAEALAEDLGAHALALDDHEARAAPPAAIDTPVLRPLAGLPGKRWPQGAYRVAKEAAEVHPQPCVAGQGWGPDEARAQLEQARRVELA